MMFMRHRCVLLFLLATVLLNGCGSDGDNIFTFEVTVDVPRQTVPGFAEPLLTNCDLVTDSLLNPASLAGLTIRLAEEEEFRGRDIIDVKRVTLKRVILKIVDEAPGGDQDTFDFLDSIRLFADDPTDMQPEVLVLALDPVPSGRKRIVIPGLGVDITQIATRDSFTLRGEVSGHPPCDNVNFVGEVEFEVQLF